MRRCRSPLLLVLSLLLLSSSVRPLRAADNVPPEGFRALFNGKDFTGWYGLGHFDPNKLAAMTDEERASKRAADMEDLKQHWKVEDGELVNDGHGVYLTTDESLGDIELWVDYKMLPLGDSGIYLRATPQVQIWDYTEVGGKWKLGADKGSGGLWNNRAGKPGKDPLVLADKPFGEWNTFRIVQVGSRTSVWLNDKLVVDHAILENFWDKERKQPLLAKGPVQLQTHGSEIRWKNVYVREIPAAEANEILAKHDDDGFTSIFNGKDLNGWKGPIENYEAVDGTIRCQPGKGGTLYHEDELTDFVARLEFKVPAGGNNGLAIRYPRHRRHGLRRHVRVAGARRFIAEIRQARSAAIPRLGLRHGPVVPRLSAAGRRVELPGGDGQRLDDSRRTERLGDPRHRPEPSDGVHGQEPAPRQGSHERLLRLRGPRQRRRIPKGSGQEAVTAPTSRTVRRRKSGD